MYKVITALTASVTVLSRQMFRFELEQIEVRDCLGKKLFYSHPTRTAFQLRTRDSFYSATLLKFQNREFVFGAFQRAGGGGGGKSSNLVPRLSLLCLPLSLGEREAEEREPGDEVGNPLLT